MSAALPICAKLRATENASADFIDDDFGERCVTCFTRNPDGPEAAKLIEELHEALGNLLKCAGRRRPDGHYEFCLVPNRDVEAAKDALAKALGEQVTP